MAIREQITPTQKNEEKKSNPLTIIAKDWETPWVTVANCNLLKPFYYANSPKVPRYSVIVVLDPRDKEVYDFISNIREIEKNENLKSLLRDQREVDPETNKKTLTGNKLLKISSNEPVEIFDADFGEVIILDELEKGTNVKVFFDIKRWTKKGSDPVEYGMTYRIKKVIKY